MRQYDDDDPSNPYDRNGILKDGHSVHVRFRDVVSARVDDAMRASPNLVFDGSGAVVAARPGFISTADSERIRRDAYEASKAELRDAWKALPVAPPAAPAQTAAPRDPRQPISMADAEAIRAAAYEAYVVELTNAWRRT
jgi:hypothetical protein